jgi:hypothetical protein
MIWLIFTNKIREAFKIPKLFTVFKDDDNGKMFKFLTCSIIFLFMMLGGLGCAALVTNITPGITDVIKQAAAPPAPTSPR